MSRRSTRGQVSRLVDTTKARMQCVDSLSSTHLTTTQICPRNMALHTHPGLRTTSTDPKQMATNTIARQIIPLPRRLKHRIPRDGFIRIVARLRPAQTSQLSVHGTHDSARQRPIPRNPPPRNVSTGRSLAGPADGILRCTPRRGPYVETEPLASTVVPPIPLRQHASVVLHAQPVRVPARQGAETE